MDTGPWVALIDRSEASHGESVQWFETFKGQILSTEAVLTEVLYLLNFSHQAQAAAMDFVLEGAIDLVPASIESLGAVKRLMKKYADLPMDFADATLVCLAQDLSIHNIATFDRKGFGIYRLSGGKAFVVLP